MRRSSNLLCGPHPNRWLAFAVAATLLTSGGCGRFDPPAGREPQASAPAAGRAALDLFVFGRMLGTIAPCGCTTEPLGGLGYAFGYIEAHSTAAGRLVVEPGSFLFPDPEGPEAPRDEAAWAQAAQRATLLQQRFAALGDRLVSGIGPTDLTSPQAAAAAAHWPLPRVLTNAGEGNPLGLPRHRLVELDVGTVGVAAVVDPGLGGADRLAPLESPVAALTREIPALRAAGADLVIVLVQGERPLAEEIARAVPGIDVVSVGHVTGTERGRVGSPAARVGDTWIVEPGEQAQTVTHLRLSIDRKAHPGGAPGPAKWTLIPPRETREAELARIEGRLAKFKDDPAADPTFLRRLEDEAAALRSSLAAADAPTDPAAATFDQVKITCRLPVDAAAASALRGYDAWVAEQNMQRFAGVTPPPPPAGEATYVGMEECEACHEEAVTFWKTTRHAQAYKTLVDDNKHYDLSCVGCHVTAFRRPGGSEVVENEHLQAIQCEQCHGPGSLHAQDPTLLGKAHGIRRQAPVEVCLECHTPEHSDTFQYEAYLRDVLGAGHGEQSRIAVGPGPTGRELRAAGVEKAGGACPKKM